MTIDFENVLASVWPEWDIVEPISVSEATIVYKARRRDMLGVSEAAIKVTVIPPDINEIDEMRMSGLDDAAVQLHLEQRVRAYMSTIQVMECVKGYTNILSVDDHKVIRDEKTGLWYVIVRMELLVPLLKRLQMAAFQEEDIIRLGIDLCSALEVCSRKSIVHRNIKPENIFIGPGGDYKLGDFGLACNLEKASKRYNPMALPNYMAPEVYTAMNEGLDYEACVRMDIYSLGIVMYYLANNKRLPFLPQDKQIVTPKERKEAIMRRINGEELPGIPRVSKQLEAIILKACAFRMEKRYATASEMRDALMVLTRQVAQGDLEETPKVAVRPNPQVDAGLQETPGIPQHISMEEIVVKSEKPVKKRKKWPRVVLSVLLAVVLALAGLGGYWLLKVKENDEKSTVSVEQTVVVDGDSRTVSVAGFLGDPVRVTITVDETDVINSMSVDASTQLLGRGRACEAASFTDQFVGRKGPFVLGENIDACSGATCTSEAVVNAVNQMQ